MAEADALSRLLNAYKDPNSSDDLQKKAKRALKSILIMCTVLDALEPLIDQAPDEILIYVLN
jgi:hypothetical protein